MSHIEWTIQEIHRYVDGSLSPQLTEKLNHDRLSDPFLNDAIEGVAGHGRLHVDHHLTRIKKQLVPEVAKRSIPILTGAIAATVLLAVGLWFFLQPDQRSNQTLAENETQTDQIESQLDDLTNDTEEDEFLVLSTEDTASNKSDIPFPPKSNESQKAQLISNVRSRQTASAKKKQVGGIVAGKVADKDGKPLTGANVFFPINQAAIVTDFDGNFAVELRSDDTVAIVNHIGYSSSVFPIAKGKSQSFLLYQEVKLEGEQAVGTGDVATNDDEIEAKTKDGLSNKLLVGGDNQLISNMNIAQPEKGFRKYNKYIKRNLTYPVEAKRLNIRGAVEIQFKVLPNGELFDFRMVRGIGFGCDEEAIRLIKSGPKWISTDQNQTGDGSYTVEFTTD